MKENLHVCVFFWDGRTRRSLDGVDEILNPDSSVGAFITPAPLRLFVFAVSTADVGLAKTGAELM